MNNKKKETGWEVRSSRVCKSAGAIVGGVSISDSMSYRFIIERGSGMGDCLMGLRLYSIPADRGRQKLMHTFHLDSEHSFLIGV